MHTPEHLCRKQNNVKRTKDPTAPGNIGEKILHQWNIATSLSQKARIQRFDADRRSHLDKATKLTTTDQRCQLASSPKVNWSFHSQCFLQRLFMCLPQKWKLEHHLQFRQLRLDIFMVDHSPFPQLLTPCAQD